MKKAKVSKGIVHHVWPNMLKDKLHELPNCYKGLKGDPVPECIVDVPDDVEPGWVWDGTQYAPIVKKPIPPPYSDTLALIAEKLGMTFDDFWREIGQRKQARRAAKEN